MHFEGNLHKMPAALGEPINYQLNLDKPILMNELIGEHISLSFEGRINCIACGRLTKKAFGQGFCYPCFQNSPMNAECIIRPELCRGHLGEGRDPEWEQKHHVQPHVVYLALTSALKVGITRDTQLPTRWIDQGAWKTIVLARTNNRFECGMIEVALKNHMGDKTPWQRMLKNECNTSIDLVEQKKLAASLVPDEFQKFINQEDEVLELHYPVTEYPTKVKSLNFDKTPEISGKLMGIRGQYLLFEGGMVLNIRKFSGYYVGISVA